MDFIISLAGQYIEIISNYRYIWYMCRNYICRVGPKKVIIPDLRISVKNEDILNLKEGSANSLPFDPGNKEDEYLEAALIQMKITEELLNKGMLLIHGSVVVTDSEAYMIAGPSGIGKTYRSIQWIKQIPNSYILNGDKPYLIIRDDRVYACGTPWCGKERFSSNKIIPLKAVFFLLRSKKTELLKLNFGDAFTDLLKQTYHPADSDKVITTIRLIKQMEGKVDFFRFLSTKEPEAVVRAYKTACYKKEVY